MKTILGYRSQDDKIHQDGDYQNHKERGQRDQENDVDGCMWDKEESFKKYRSVPSSDDEECDDVYDIDVDDYEWYPVETVQNLQETPELKASTSNDDEEETEDYEEDEDNEDENEEEDDDDDDWEDCDADDENDDFEEHQGDFVTSTGIKKNPTKNYSSEGLIKPTTFFLNTSPIPPTDDKEFKLLEDSKEGDIEIEQMLSYLNISEEGYQVKRY